MIYEQPLAAVDPIRLAEVSAVTRIKRFAAPVAPVMTPFLLTGQLRKALGGCCGDCTYSGMAGGMIPPDYGSLRLGMPTDLGFDINSLQVPSAGSGNISVLQTAAVGANFIPGIGTIGAVTLTMLNQLLTKFESWFGIGAGRREADIIVPVQNQLMSHLGTITNQFLTGMSPSVSQLNQLYRDVWASAVGFQEFVLMRNFTDRRASGQALNTVMPYIDGSCGYAIPAPWTETPSQFHCISWGDGTVGGVGQDGMLGALTRALGSNPGLPDLHQAANSGIRPTQIIGGPGGGLIPGLPPTVMGVSTPLALIGLLALFWYSRK
jgi:hypothetical protein